MVQAWYLDDSDIPNNCPHLTDPPQFVEVETLKQVCGIEHFQVCLHGC